MKRRLAVHAMDLVVVFPILDHEARHSESAAQVLASGRYLADLILAEAHGESSPGYGPPGLREVDAWRTAAARHVVAASAGDPTYVQSYLAGLSADQQRLIRSFLR